MKTNLNITRRAAATIFLLLLLSPASLSAQSFSASQMVIKFAELWVNKRQDSILNKVTNTHTFHYNLDIELQNASSAPSSSCVLDFKVSGLSASETQLGLWPAGQSSPTFVIPAQTTLAMQFETNALDQNEFKLTEAFVRLVCPDSSPKVGGWQSVDLHRTVWDVNSIGQFDTRAP